MKQQKVTRNGGYDVPLHQNMTRREGLTTMATLAGIGGLLGLTKMATAADPSTSGVLPEPQDSTARTRPIIIAHRGASGYLPEHTLEAKAMAHAMRADYIEQDVVLTKDDVPVILHDVHLDTVTDVATRFSDKKRDDGRYYAIDLTLAEIKTLKVTERIDLKTGKAVFPQRFPIGKSDFSVPTLVEELELIQGLNRSTGRDVGVYVEIKAPAWHRTEGKEISDIVLDVLKDYGYKNRADTCFLQCFEADECRRIRHDLKSDLKLLLLMDTPTWTKLDVAAQPQAIAKDLAEVARFADGIGPALDDVVTGRGVDGNWQITPLVELAHRYHLAVHPYTMRRDQLPTHFPTHDVAMQVLVHQAHVDGLFCDFPDLGVNFIDRDPRFGNQQK
ncbi:MAG: glycerophosphodiester phosphodiesterase [Planctomycetaceae bacterium]